MFKLVIAICLVWTAWLHAQPQPAATDAKPIAIEDNDIVLKAMVEEMDRSMQLELESLQRPYFIEYRVEDTELRTIAAKFGAILNNRHNRSRDFACRVRVGDPGLDNTNYIGARPMGVRTTLPIDDDPIALRQSIWWATDTDYKRAVEALTHKKAHLERVHIEDRPADFAPADPQVHIDPGVELVPLGAEWESRLMALSARFKKYPRIQDSSVNLVAAVGNVYTVNSEGTRLRTADTGYLLSMNAELQAPDGMPISDSRTYGAYAIEDLPSMDMLAADADALCESLIALADAPMLEDYMGPVLLDGVASPQMFASLLGARLGASPDPVGGRPRSGDDSLDKKIGKRVLPRSFRAYDDPTMKSFQGQALFGWYTYDDQGVPARRVDLVEKGKLLTLLMSRTPTRELSGSNGHGRSPRLGFDASGAMANLFVESDDGMSDDELRREMIDLCSDEDLAFGLRIVSLEGIRGGRLADPLMAYKVYVDGRPDELIRGLQSKPFRLRTLRRIVASGTEPHLYNFIAGSGMAVVAPSVLMEELEFAKPPTEFDKLPILDPPALRGRADATGGQADATDDSGK